MLGVALSRSGLATPGELQVIGLLALSDPPRPEAAGCVAMLRSMGVDVVMVTGDAPATAGAVARAIGLNGTVASAAAIPRAANAHDFAVFAGVLPEEAGAAVKTHMDSCAACRSLVRDLTELDEAPLQPAEREKIWGMIRAGIAVEESGAKAAARTPWWGLFWRPMPVAIAAAAAVLLVIGGRLMRNPEPPTAVAVSQPAQPPAVAVPPCRSAWAICSRLPALPTSLGRRRQCGCWISSLRRSACPMHSASA